MTSTDKEYIKQQLERFGFTYREHDQRFEVELGMKLQGVIDLSQPGKVILSERLASWNLLTGFKLTRNLDRYIQYVWFLMSFVFGMSLGYFMASKSDSIGFQLLLISFFLASMSLVTSASIMYVLKVQSFRQMVMSWMKDR